MEGGSGSAATLRATTSAAGGARKPPAPRVRTQERRDFLAQRLIPSTSLGEEGRAPARLELQGSLIELLDLLPSLRLHLAPPRPPRDGAKRGPNPTRAAPCAATLRRSGRGSASAPASNQSGGGRLH